MPSCCLWVVQQMPSCTKRQVSSCTFNVSIFFKDTVLRCFFTLLAKSSRISEYLKVLLNIYLQYQVHVCRLSFFAGMKSWQMLTAGIGMNIATLVVKTSPRSSRLHVVQTFYHFVCWLTFFFILNFNQQYVILNFHETFLMVTNIMPNSKEPPTMWVWL